MALVFLCHHHFHCRSPMLRLLLPSGDLCTKTSRMEARQASERNWKHGTTHRVRQPRSYATKDNHHRDEKTVQVTVHATNCPSPRLLHGIFIRTDVPHAVDISHALVATLWYERWHRFIKLHIHGPRILPRNSNHGPSKRCIISSSQEAQQWCW